jgi:hypothetical protein
VCVFVSVLILVIGGQSGDSSKGAINKGDNLPNYCKEKAKCVDFVELDDIEDSAKFKDGKVRTNTINISIRTCFMHTYTHTHAADGPLSVLEIKNIPVL